MVMDEIIIIEDGSVVYSGCSILVPSMKMSLADISPRWYRILSISDIILLGQAFKWMAINLAMVA